MFWRFISPGTLIIYSLCLILKVIVLPAVVVANSFFRGQSHPSKMVLPLIDLVSKPKRSAKRRRSDHFG